ncbi:MAG TPA: hypothetical protein PK821_02835 [Victivallales bacterium]|nr:hypothetical protein [Victivallales bacterium]
MAPSRWNGGRLSKFVPTSTIVQDWIMLPTATTPQPNVYYVNTHSRGGNALTAGGSVSFKKTSEATKFNSASNEIGNCNPYLFQPIANTN